MSTPVKLSAIIDEMSFQSDERRAYLNKKTGEVVSITDEEFSAAENDKPLEDFPEWERDNIKIAGEILESNDYLELPDKFEINEYGMMERFYWSIKDEALSNTLYGSIKGSGAFRRFKDNIRRFGIEQDWYKFRDEAIKEIAIEWCQAYEIPFVDQ